MNRFLDLADFSRDEVVDLLALAQRLQDRPEPAALAGRILGLLFLNPSLRTLSSFQAGMMRLGGQSFVVTPGQGTWQVETRSGAVMNGSAAEHVREAIPVLASYCDALGIRSFAEGKDLAADLAETQFGMMAQMCDKPFVNMESAVNHPCQALADWKTMDDLGVPRRGKFVLSWVYHPRALAARRARRNGAHGRTARDGGRRAASGWLCPARCADAQSACGGRGGRRRRQPNRPIVRAALEGANVVYAKEWGSPLHYGNAEAEARLRQPLGDWCVRESWFDQARADCHFMHCLPVRRNVAVADEVLDGPRSRVIREAANRMVVQMAVLYRLLKG